MSLSCVAPYVGAWIEIFRKNSKDTFLYVAPYVGAWIEIPESQLEEIKK